MGDPSMRKSAALCRLRNNLRKKRESLADQFDFKMFILFHFKEKKKNCAIFEVTEVLPVMTNNYEESILKGAKSENYSMESSRELLEKDVVQLHGHRWQSMRRDVIGCTTDVDFFLWPRKDIEKIECMLFSRWKGDSSPYRQIVTDYEFAYHEYEAPLVCLLSRKERNNMIINNPNQSMFLFIDRLQLETQKNTVTILKLSSICLYLPQDKLTHWTAATVDSAVNPLLS